MKNMMLAVYRKIAVRLRRSLACMVLAGTAIVLNACGTANQPQYAQAFQATNPQALIEKRDIELSPLSRFDGRLAVEMLSITDEGNLLMRTKFGIDEYSKGQQKLLNGQYIVLVDSDPDAQVARLQTWAKPIF